MEKAGKKTIPIILTGPESTGKTALARELAQITGGICVEEYAREYVMHLGRKYTYADVEHIAEKQRSQMEAFRRSGESPVFFDTYLIITKVWFEVVFGKGPPWLDAEIKKSKSALYLLCRPDIPWEPDPLRENGGAMRQTLFERYEQELILHELNYRYVEGTGKVRIRIALDQIRDFLKTNGYDHGEWI